jgi:hypothetical protein
MIPRMKTLVTLFATFALATAFSSCQTTAKKQECKTGGKNQASCCGHCGKKK